jgi:hypothetical protein
LLKEHKQTLAKASATRVSKKRRRISSVVEFHAPLLIDEALDANGEGVVTLTVPQGTETTIKSTQASIDTGQDGGIQALLDRIKALEEENEALIGEVQCWKDRYEIVDMECTKEREEKRQLQVRMKRSSY